MGFGAYTEYRLFEQKPFPEFLLEDFGYYQTALQNALTRQPVYLPSIGTGYLYPLPALFWVEIFEIFDNLWLRAGIFWVINTLLVIWLIDGVRRHYGYSFVQTWYWYPLALGYAPFLETLHIGQINILTLWGIFFMFFWQERNPLYTAVGWVIAVLSKVSPILFFPYLIVHKKYRVLGVAFILGMTLLILSAIRYGWDAFFDYPQTFRWLLTQFRFGENPQAFAIRLKYLTRPEIFQPFLQIFPVWGQNFLASLAIFLSNHLLVQKILTLVTLSAIGISSVLTFLGRQPREPLFLVTLLTMTLSPNIMWYHHYVFLLLPVFVMIAWLRLNTRIVLWCLVGLLTVQWQRTVFPYGLLVHIWGHLSWLMVLTWQIRLFWRERSKIWQAE
ncbi:MAG: hypothetical protein OHK0052_26620 [Anaerolineales bacterium]